MKVSSTSVILIVAGGGVVAMSQHARADILLDQPHDSRSSIESDFMGPALSAQAGDDFRPTGPVIVESATFWMIATWANPPLNWTMAVHRSTDDSSFWDFSPEYPSFFHRTGPSNIVDLGKWNDDGDLHLYEIRYDDLDLYLDPADSLKGVFWFASFGHIVDRNLQESRWGTSGNGVLNGEGAWWKTIPWVWPGWRPWSGNSDLAMRIEGEYIPTPGALTPCALLVLRRGRRRRVPG